MHNDNDDGSHAPKLLERILRSSESLLALETANVVDTLAHLRMLSLRSGTSAYVWEPDAGLTSLRESGLHVPGSKRFRDALRYVAQSVHFAVYLFVRYDDQMNAADTVLLRRISRTGAGNERKLVFVGNSVALPAELDGMVERISALGIDRPGLRLRDGHWVE